MVQAAPRLARNTRFTADRATGRNVPIWVVDAFTSRAFAGNPAGVCLLDAAAPAPWMQAVAAEMRHSETAFAHPIEAPDAPEAPSSQEDAGHDWDLRWFTPSREVDLCGHATLATAHVLWESQRAPGPIRFHTRSGILTCDRHDGRIAMQFPAAPARPLADPDVPGGLWDALGIAPGPVGAADNGNLLITLPDADAVRAVAPDFPALRKVSGRHGYILAAPGEDDADVAIRYFVPAWGIDEDPATGSIQCTLGPHWAERLGKDRLVVDQLSERGARMHLHVRGDVVEVAGTAVTVLEGALRVLGAP